MSRPQKCQHIKPGGGRCGSPALRGKRFCYFHHVARRQHPHRVARAPLLPDWAIVEDPRSALAAINQVLQGLADGSLDTHTAGIILFGLQTAMNMNPNSAATDRGVPSSAKGGRKDGPPGVPPPFAQNRRKRATLSSLPNSGPPADRRF